ncbi:MAG: hypothetical protein RLO52_05830 [Sandaracinaceae bacterium]
MSDGSFPHKQPQPDVPEPPPKEERVGARVLDFPTEEVTGNSIVPAGTWADDAADGAPDASTDRLLRPAGGDAPGGEVVEFPRSASTAKRRRVQAPDVSGTQPTQLPRKRDDEETVQRPRFLASELLRQEWWPRTPLERTNRWGAVAVGAGGLVGVFAMGGLAGNAIGLAALFFLCAAVGLAPVEARVRGAILAVVGAAGAGWVAWMSAQGDGGATPLLVACTVLGASSLFFRAAHRKSRLARILVGVGLAAAAAWLFFTGGVDGFVVETMDWQSWVGPTTRLMLVVVLVTAVLSFLDPTGHGGAWIAGFAFLVWLALHSAGAMVVAAFPGRAFAELDWTDARWVATLALPFFCAVAASGLCQVWAMLPRRG